jgi:hypothetical protein
MLLLSALQAVYLFALSLHVSRVLRRDSCPQIDVLSMLLQLLGGPLWLVIASVMCLLGEVEQHRRIFREPDARIVSDQNEIA